MSDTDKKTIESKYKDAVEVLKSNKAYDRILREMANKYKQKGSLGGSIELKELTSEERLLLCKMDSSFINSKNAKFTLRKFLNTFNNTALEGLDFLEILKLYFNDDLITNKELRENKALKKEEFFAKVLQEFQETKAYIWLKSSLENKSYGYQIIIKEYEKDRKNLKGLLYNVMTGVNTLEEYSSKLRRLAIFASNITKDPHYFDNSNLGGKLLISALAYINKSKTPETSEEENALLESFGIVKDEISNYTTCSSIKAYSKDGIHLGIEDFYKRYEPVQLNLWNLSRIESIECKNNVLFVFENPTVFSEVLQHTKDLRPSLLCTSGQLKLASILFLDKVISKVYKIYYSGDFDPEGINIAYRLRQRYGEKLEFWRFDEKIYKNIKSKVKIEDRRLKQLEGINSEELTPLINEIKKEGVCGYQELLVEKYLEDIRSTQGV